MDEVPRLVTKLQRISGTGPCEAS